MTNAMNTKNCMNMQFELLNGMFFDKKEENENYILCSSKVMDDYFWNIAYLKTNFNEKMLNELEEKFNNINRNPSLYIGCDEDNYSENKSFIIKTGYEINNTDVFMQLITPHKSEINIEIKVVENEKEYNDFMKVLSSAYNDTIENSEENVYADAVTECYYNAVKNTINSNKHYHIIAYADNIPVSVATLNYIDGVGGINNVGTAQGYWNKGYGKQVLTYLIDLFEKLGGGILTLSTEHNSKNQKFYEKLGFEEKYVMEQYMK